MSESSFTRLKDKIEKALGEKPKRDALYTAMKRGRAFRFERGHAGIRAVPGSRRAPVPGIQRFRDAGHRHREQRLQDSIAGGHQLKGISSAGVVVNE